MSPTQSCAVCPVRREALCACLDAREIGALSAIGQRRRLRRGQALQWAGERSRLCGTLISGVLKLSATTADGREQLVGLLYPSDFVGRPWAAASDFTVTALGDAELCTFPQAPFEGFLEAHETMERHLLRRTLAALDEARGRMLKLARFSAREKVAGLLLDLADRAQGSRASADGPVTFDLPLTRGEMAELLGLTIETVSRQLTRLKREQAINLMGARGITIRDRARLEAA